MILENPGGKASVLLVCDHASNAIPARLGSLGLERDDLERHIALDIGALGITRKLAALLDAPAVIAGYSRLVIDCNRRPHHPDSIMTETDSTPVPGNPDLSRADAQRRADACFWPYHRRIAAPGDSVIGDNEPYSGFARFGYSIEIHAGETVEGV